MTQPLRSLRRRRRSLAVPVAVATTFSLLLAGCGSDDSGGGGDGATACEPSDGPVELTFATWVPGMEDVVKLWNDENPDVQVTVQNVPSGNTGTYQNFTNALKAGTAPDLGQIEYDSLPNFRLQQGLTDISECPGVAEAEEAFVPWTWAQVDFNGSGGVYAVPQDTGPMALFYRKDVFDKLGLEPPATWDEYGDAARAIKQADPKQRITFFSQSDPNWYTGLYWQAGAQLFKTDGDAVSVDIEGNPQVEQVNEYWQGLIDDDLVATDLQGFSEELYKAWNTGEVVTWVSAAWGYSTIRDNAPDTAGKWGVAPMPQWEEGGTAAGNWGGSSTAVLTGTDHPAEAAEFALWLNTDPEALALENELGGLYPAAVDGLEIDALQQGVDFYGGEKIFDVFKEASGGVDSSFQWGPTMTDTYAALKDGIVDALSGSGTLDDATSAAQEKTLASLEAQGVQVAD